MSPEKWHAVKHRRERPFEDCWDCQRLRAICRSKRRYTTREDAEAIVREINEGRAYERPVQRYVCRWCLSWHLTSRLDDRGVKRAEKQRRKWIVAQAVAR